MATIYVSNVAVNGYGLGNDGTGNGTKATPYLTIQKAHDVANAGDTVLVNATGTVYVLNYTAGYLAVTKALTIQSDQGVATLQANAGASRMVNTTATLKLTGFIMDCNNIVFGWAVNFQGSNGSVFTSLQFKNMASSQAFTGLSGSAATAVIDKCILSTNDGNSTNAKLLNVQASDFHTVTISGCVVKGTSVMNVDSTSSSLYTQVVFTKSSDGTRNTFTSLALPITIPNSTNNQTFTASYIDFVSMGAVQCIIDYASTNTNVSLAITGNTFAGTVNPISLIGVHSFANVSNNVFNCPGVVAISLGGTPKNFTINENTITASTAVSSSVSVNEMFFVGNRVKVSTAAFVMGVSFYGPFIAKNEFVSTAPGAIIYSAGLGANYSGINFLSNKVLGFDVVAITLRNVGTNNTFDGNYFNGSGGLLVVLSVFQTNVQVSNNMLIQCKAVANVDVIQLYAGAGIRMFGNTLYTDGLTVHGMFVGTDGFISKITNVTSSALQNFGDVSGNTYFAQPFNFISSPSDYNSQQIGAVELQIKKVGTPTGTVTVQLYTDNAGAPGTLAATSAYTMNASDATGTAQYFNFYFETRLTAAYATKYWIVAKYNGAADAANYLQLSANTSAAILGQTSTNGTNWSASANAALFNVQTGCFEAVNPQIYNNKLYSTNNGYPQFHAVFFGATTGGVAYGNYIKGGGPLLIAKLADGSATPLVIYSNVVHTDRGSQQGLRDKGSRYALFYNNTAVVDNARANCALADNDFQSGRFNGQPSRNVSFKNNIMINQGYTSGRSVVQLGSGVANTCISPTLDCNIYYVTGDAALVQDSRTSANTRYTTLDSWKATAGSPDANSLLKSPALPGSASGFKQIADFAPAYTDAQSMAVGADLRAQAPSDFMGQVFFVGALPAGTKLAVGAFKPIANRRLA